MHRARLAPALLVVFLLCLAGPILLVPVPELLDYPNHLARLWLLGGGLEQPPFPDIYRLDWGTLTNLGVDLLSIPLQRLLSAVQAGQVFLYLGAALPLLGAVLLNRALFGGITWWQLGFGLAAWNLTILAGFLNFNIGLGLALLAAAADPWAARRGAGVAFGLRFACSLGLLVIHAFGLFLYAALLCGLALGPGWRGLLSRSGLLARVRPVLLAAAPPLAVLLLMLLLAPALPGAHETAPYGLSEWQRLVGGSRKLLLGMPGVKLRNAFALFQTYRFRFDLLAVALLAIPALMALLRQRLRAHAGLLGVALALGGLFLLAPHYAMGTGWIDLRLAEMASLALLVALRPEVPRRWAPGLAALMLALGLARTGFVALVWQAREADVQSVARALRPVPAGAAVLPLEHAARPREAPLGRYFTDGFPAYQHLPALAVPWRHAFVPTLFTARGKQPISVRPPWDQIAVPEGPVVTAQVLTDPGVLEGWYDTTLAYVAQWQERFDYMLLVNADLPDKHGPVHLPPEMELLADEGFARLYRIHHAPETAQATR